MHGEPRHSTVPDCHDVLGPAGVGGRVTSLHLPDDQAPGLRQPVPAGHARAATHTCQSEYYLSRYVIELETKEHKVLTITMLKRR